MTAPSQSSNPHLADSILVPFLSPSFSPTDYLNSSLPSIGSAKQSKASPSLTSVASQTQSHVSALNAQTSRLSTTLTSLTDDILRTSSRLTYEVELLRGEAFALAESLTSRGDLNEDILKLVPAGLNKYKQPPNGPSSPTRTEDVSQELHPRQAIFMTELQDDSTESIAKEPEALPRLRTLLHVRAQLQTVIQRFNFALSFPFPPSLISTTASSLISVNPPNQDPDLERTGQAALARIKQEVLDILADAEGRGGGAGRARDRVAELKNICTIWKGTGEERARSKWVDDLELMIEDEIRKKENVRSKALGTKPEVKRDTSTARGPADAGSNGPGFLRRLREEIYME
ncbi:hypothetical protein ACLMJK_007568 [Lecanora helva]